MIKLSSSQLELVKNELNDGELIRNIKEYEELYAITNHGRVWSHRVQKFLVLYTNNCGYHAVCLRKNGKVKTIKVHRLVAEAFVPVPSHYSFGTKLDVCHLDDCRTNNRADNLAWMTRSENLNTDSFREKTKNRIFSKVKCVETGEIYPSIRAAGKAVGMNYYGINLCLLGRQRTCGGYHWERIVEKLDK